MANYVRQQPQATGPSNTYRVAPVVATYADQAHRTRLINGALLIDKPHYQAGVTVSTAAPYFPAGVGGVGVVCSPLDSAVGFQNNNWHHVGVLRHGNSAWIHDPAYVMGSQTRLPAIPGTSNVTRLLNTHILKGVNYVQVQGLGGNTQDCMGRSVQWVDNVIQHPNATAPFPLGTFVSGQPTPGWQVVQRY
jgi:hypothetical protein